jgi:hypothetical protein
MHNGANNYQKSTSRQRNILNGNFPQFRSFSKNKPRLPSVEQQTTSSFFPQYLSQPGILFSKKLPSQPASHSYPYFFTFIFGYAHAEPSRSGAQLLSHSNRRLIWQTQ